MIIDNINNTEIYYPRWKVYCFFKRNKLFGEYFKCFNSTVQFLNALQVTAWYSVHLQVVKKITSAVEGILNCKWSTLFISVADPVPWIGVEHPRSFFREIRKFLGLKLL